MLNISLCFNRKDFEYDVYSLIKAFYPGCEITSWYEEDGAPDGEFAYYDTITYEADQICFSIADEKHETLASQCEAVEYEKDRHETKNVLKRMVYRTLSEVSGKELPWGDLTGIRPTKIPMKMLEEGKKNVEIAKYMRETYYTSPEKTALAITIANREKDILKTIDYEHGYSLYIGIPFCPSICLYCSFGSHVLSRWEHMVDPYLDALIKELIFISENMKDYTLDTIYIGGGTPTTLNAAQMERLLTKVTELFPMEQVQEFTVEAGRPDTINEEVLKAIRKFPVTRISINPQTMNQETLDIIGRKHTVGQVRDAFYLARSCGMDNINMDFIVGLPDETEDMVKYCINFLLENSHEDLELFDKFVEPGLFDKLHNIVENGFARITYAEAIDIMKKSGQKFEYEPEFGIDMQTEHERFLAEKHFKRPVIVRDYPKEIKAFYMRLNDDGKTVAAMDVLVPGIGELIGGSQREERLDVLTARIKELGMDPADYDWYLDLRRFGSVKHAGYGLGFERLLMYVTGIPNIRDVIAFPRTCGGF